MLDVQASEISEKDLEAAFRFAHPEVSYKSKFINLGQYFHKNQKVLFKSLNEDMR